MNPQAEGWSLGEDVGLPEMVRPLWTRQEGTVAAFGFQTGPAHFNGRDMVHGGIMALFADHALGLTVRRAVDAAPAATIQLDINYIGVTRPGAFVEVRAEILRRTRSIVFVRGLLTVDATLVATANGVWKILSRPAPA
ncbi:hotdog domain-containing protein [Roseomonas marmotae]|uniref:PaaI family thioesterase n=1 Tax=Roseomonas marmotae TaxID=2768161 RepID=A0ABS3KHJ0_9PROT|nr:PaaI family thioesterase [Roseomonas marmotae]